VKVPNLQDVAFKADVDALARRVDPDTFAKYDKLVEGWKTNETYQGQPVVRADTPQGPMPRNIDPVINRRGAVFANGRWHEGTVQSMGQILVADSGLVFKTRSDATVQLEDGQTTQGWKPPNWATTGMAELTPLIERAYARAKDEWNLTAAERIAVAEMVSQRASTANFTGDSARIVEAAMERQQLEDLIPVLSQRPLDMKSDADAADVQMRVYDERDKAVADQAEVVTNDAKKLIKQAEAWDELDADAKRAKTEAREPGELPPDQFKLPGYDEPMSLNDRIEVMNEDTGAIETISVRELLQRQVDTDEDLKAVSSCSIR